METPEDVRARIQMLLDEFCRSDVVEDYREVRLLSDALTAARERRDEVRASPMVSATTMGPSSYVQEIRVQMATLELKNAAEKARKHIRLVWDRDRGVLTKG